MSSVIMNAVNGAGSTDHLLRLNKIEKLKVLRMHPNAPKLSDPDQRQLTALVTYWSTILRNLENILFIQRYEPDYMPVCELVEIENDCLKITILKN